jgi:NhaP-type Na+/H+ or K+/H+ antiporter
MHLDPALTIAGVLLLGVGCQWLAWRIKLPAILPLLFSGLALGPLLGILQPQAALGDLFFPLISLSVAIILFEGALTLAWDDVRHVMGPVRNLLTIGALVSWFGGAAAAHYITGLRWELALLFGALIIVTGPTVIAPLLRNVRPNHSVASVLRWEGILIDAIGATVAVLVFEAIVARTDASIGSGLLAFLWIVGVGSVLGLGGGFALATALRRYWIPDYLRDVVILAFVLGIFALSNTLAHESGLTAVTIMGVFLANGGLKQLHEVLYFKEKLSILLISVLFILLAANVTRADLALLDWRSLLLLLVVMFVLRPLGVALSTLRSTLNCNERIFLGWIAPRGIVAASVSSLFAFSLVDRGVEDARIIAPLIFLIIVGTVLAQGLTAKPLARALGVSEADPQGILLMGANSFACELAHALQRAGVLVRLVDSNRRSVTEARLQGLDAVTANMLSDYADRDLDLGGLGRLLALTANDEANTLACRHFVDEFGSSHVYQLPPDLSPRSGDGPNQPRLGRLLFAPDATYAHLAARLADSAVVKTTQLTDKYTWADFQREQGPCVLPLLAINGGRITVASTERPFKPLAGSQVITLGACLKPGDPTAPTAPTAPATSS